MVVNTSEKRVLIHRYKLIENYKFDKCQLGRVNLSTTEWTRFTDKKDSLDKYLKTFYNPDGCVYYEVINAAKNNELVSKMWYDIKEFPKMYSKIELSVMEREELCDISKYYSIITINRPNNILIKFILEMQAVRIERYKDQIPEESKLLNEQVIEEENKIIEELNKDNTPEIIEKAITGFSFKTILKRKNNG